MVTYYARRGRQPRVQGSRRPDATASPRPALRARRPHAHRARVGAGDDAIRSHEAPAGPRGRRARGHPTAGPGEAALPEPGPDPARPRPLDRQVHGAPSVGARGSQARTGGDCMTTMTAQATQIYSVLTVVHDQLEGSPKTAASVAGVGWMMVLSGLKTLLETGKPLAS